MWTLTFCGCEYGDRPIPAYSVTGTQADITALYNHLRAYWHFTYIGVFNTKGEHQDWI